MKFRVLAWFYCILVLILCNMELNQEQRTVIKFLVSTGVMPIDCWQKLWEGYNTSTVGQKTVRKWHKRFLQGDTLVKDKPCTRRPKSARSAEGVQSIQDAL